MYSVWSNELYLLGPAICWNGISMFDVVMISSFGLIEGRASCLLSFIVFYCNDLGSDSRSQVEEIINQFPFIDLLLPCDRKSIKYFTNVYMYTVIVLSFSVVFLDLVTLSGRGGFIFTWQIVSIQRMDRKCRGGGLDGVWNKQVTTSSSVSKQIQPGSQETVRTLNYEPSIRGGALWLGVIQKWGMDPKPSQASWWLTVDQHTNQ